MVPLSYVSWKTLVQVYLLDQTSYVIVMENLVPRNY
jgi:hypothetical protein